MWGIYFFHTKLVEENQKYKEGEYDIKFDANIYFEVYYTIKDWDEEMMRVVKYLMDAIACDCVLEYYGIPIMTKKDGNIVIDESLTGRPKKFPFHILNCV